MTTLKEIQVRLNSLGFSAGIADGKIGPKTIGAMSSALDALSAANQPEGAPSGTSGTIPASWLPSASMARIILHWTAGANKATDFDRTHYHILVESDGSLIRGVPSIDLNQSPVKPGYAAHTLNCNSGSIGVSLCGMAGAIERPFNAGKYPITAKQFDAAAKAVAQLCRRYSIAVTPETVLSHAEVQGTLGITQRGKWDIAILPFDPALNTARKVGDAFRALVKSYL
ncbi:N-acetylmuramoyl-L-alanine amidase [Brucella pseudogrignonensis]|uniref:Peptidoglycan hydrolase-like protein with peptidoglycan-binding domain n=1 Tax=Brucella pseudogrignonensis TaxID=419475 RepID=A0ABU1M5M5_9HYPH|nr:N-acetylmuramoyl-L-alanine amidase [Brucella pseudogrignonensis]MDR6431317.1 peptidoglycan hydrolase-like protein with peptidoglycan-binding domain [Brucella pseudogrignonensis]